MNNRWLATIAFLSGLLISGVAAWFSIIGFTKLFASIATTMVIFGAAIEVGKLVSASWLFHNWIIAPRLLKYPLIAMVCILMFLTSMGVWGYLNKSYADQTAPMAQTNIELNVVKAEIKSQEEALANAKAQADQISRIVNKRIDAKGDDTSLAALRQTNKQLSSVESDRKKIQASLATLRQQQAKLESANQVIAHEVGPINYIAKTFYGNSDQDTVDKAVQFVILLLVLVFDPLAIALLLAANFSMGKKPLADSAGMVYSVQYSPDDPTPVTSEELIQHLNTNKTEEPETIMEVREPIHDADEAGSATQELEIEPPFQFVKPESDTSIGQVIHHADGSTSYKG